MKLAAESRTGGARLPHIAAAWGIAGAIWNHPANRNRRLLALARSLRWQFVKHALKRPITIRFHGHKLKCYPDSTSTSGAVYFSGYPDFWEMKFLQAYLRPGDNFLDIGANMGVYSILAASYVGPHGCIDAFEPVEGTAARAEEQATLNGLHQMRVHRYAVSDRDGELDFGFATNNATMHVRRTGEDSTEGRFRVKSITLDTFEPYRQYAAGKMDIEGAEPMALAGAATRLRQCNPPVWLLELAGYSTCYGVTSDKIVQMLADAHYDCAVYNPQLGALEYTGKPWEMGAQNVLAISREHKAIVEQRLVPYAAKKT